MIVLSTLMCSGWIPDGLELSIFAVLIILCYILNTLIKKL